MDFTDLFENDDELYMAGIEDGEELANAIDKLETLTQAVITLFHTAVRGPISRDTTMRIMVMLSPEGMMANSIAYLRYAEFIDDAQMTRIVEKISTLPTIDEVAEESEDPFSQPGLSA